MPILHLGSPLLFVTSSTYRQPADMPPQPGSKRDYPNDLRTWTRQPLPNLKPNIYFSFPFDWQLAPRVKPIDQPWLESGNNLPPLLSTSITLVDQLTDRPFIARQWDKAWLEAGNNLPPVLPTTLPAGSQLFDRQFLKQGTGQSWLNAGNSLSGALAPVGEQLFDRLVTSPTSGLTWLGTGNGLTAFPTGNQFFDRQFIKPTSGLTWLGSGNGLTSVTALPVGEQLFDRPVLRFKPIEQTWLEAGNNLPPVPISILPPGSQLFDRLALRQATGQTWLGVGNNFPPIPPQIITTFQPTPFDWQLTYPTPFRGFDHPQYNANLIPVTINVPQQPYFAWHGQWPRLQQTAVFPNTTLFLPTVFNTPTSFDWQLTRPTYSGQTWLEAGNNFPPLPVVVTALPLNQYDWPLPKGYSRLEQTWLQNLASSSPAIPLNQFNWPLPKQYSKLDQTWLQNYAVLFSAPSALPFNQYNWPLPVGYNRIDESGTVGYAVYLPTPVMPPYAYDWPNPKAYQRDITVNDIQNQPTSFFIPPFVPPPVTDVHFMPFIGSVGQMKAW